MFPKLPNIPNLGLKLEELQKVSSSINRNIIESSRLEKEARNSKLKNHNGLK
jgi:hypothetical protein